MLKADAHDLKTIFEKQRKHKVPLFQRRYVWDQEKQWEPLWEDVQTVAERFLDGENPQPHFLGAVVLKQDETASKEIETRLVIDGQQRLTTLQLLIAAARDVYQTLGDVAKKRRDNLNFLVTNQAGVEQDDDIFKVWPTQVDQSDFRHVMTACSPDNLRKLMPEDDSRVREAYLYFYDRVEAWLKAGPDHRLSDRVEALHNALYKGLILVVIDLSQEDNAQIIFESLNARGTPLLESELVKNFLLHLAEEKRLPSKDLHDKYWQPFDTDPFWQAEVKQGRLFRPRIEVFLQHYLTMQLVQEVPALDLFDTFKDYVMRQPALSPEDHLIHLHHYANIFRKFYPDGVDDPEDLFFYRIDVMEMTTLFPLLLFVFDRLNRAQHAEQRRAILLDLESFLVRRMICGLTTKQYNKLFLDLKLHLQTHPTDLVAETRAYLLSRTADSELWPDDKQFRQAWMTEPLYRRITRSRLRMVLEALEMQSRTSKTEDVTPPKRLTIEHLLPRAWQQHWPLPENTPEAEERRQAVLHTIGNLTLVTGSLNPALRNSAWPAKHKEILKHSILKLNSYFHGVEDWGEDRIAERGQQLFEVAVKVWPRPSQA